MTTNPRSGPAMTPEVRRGVIKWIVGASIGVVGYGAILFLSAGRLNWPAGWAFFSLLVLLMAAHPLLLIPLNPDLLAERQRGWRVEGVKSWDRIINSLNGGLMLLTWVVAGFDQRWGWPGDVPVNLQRGAFVVAALGYGIFLWAMVSNAFFSEGVRIQTERGHKVVRSGPYRFVRHPGYVGVLLSHLAVPLLLDSYWALIPAIVLAALVVLRTMLEDRTLRAELPGYEAFTQQTRFRLLPGLW
jgi:protein-S-isoprenylcysteine O-methyltransferase Ste14